MAKKRERKKQSKKTITAVAAYCRRCGMTLEGKRRHSCPSDELKKIRLGTAPEERKRACAWMNTAAQHDRNEDYWRERAQRRIEMVIGSFK
jgi:hypothetical protein